MASCPPGCLALQKSLGRVDAHTHRGTPPCRPSPSSRSTPCSASGTRSSWRTRFRRALQQEGWACGPTSTCDWCAHAVPDGNDSCGSAHELVGLLWTTQGLSWVRTRLLSQGTGGRGPGNPSRTLHPAGQRGTCGRRTGFIIHPRTERKRACAEQQWRHGHYKWILQRRIASSSQQHKWRWRQRRQALLGHHRQNPSSPQVLQGWQRRRSGSLNAQRSVVHTRACPQAGWPVPASGLQS